MRREDWAFKIALLVSLGLHAILFPLFFFIPAGGSSDQVRVYTVRILEAPRRPEARELVLSTKAISALTLESPSLRSDLPVAPEPDTAEVPSAERFSRALPPAPPADLSTAPAAPSVPQSLTALQPPGAPQIAPLAAPLPRLPAPAQPVAVADKPAAPESRRAIPPPPPPPEEHPPPGSAMERLRSKVRRLNLLVEPVAPAQRPTPAPGERNLLSLRIYSNRVREAVKEQYAFPGGFASGLRTRVRVEIEKDGSVRKSELLESSGDSRFDNLVCMAAFEKAKLPPIPDAVGEERLVLHFTCTP